MTEHTGQPGADDLVAGIAEQLPKLRSRQAAEALLRNDNLTVKQLREVARRLNISMPHARKDAVIHRLVENAVGFRLTHEAILGRPYLPVDEGDR